MNDRALDYFDRPRDQLIGRSVWEVLPSAATAALRSQLTAGAPAGASIDVGGKAGRGRVLEVRTFPSAAGFALRFRDVTERRHFEGRDRFLVRFDGATRNLTDPQEISAVSVRLLGHQLNVDRCVTAHGNLVDGTFEITAEYRRNVPSLVGRFRFSQFGAALEQAIRNGESFVLENAETDPRTAAVRDEYRRVTVMAAVVAPVLTRGGFAAGVAVHQARPRAWTAGEIELVQRTANRCWEAIDRARLARSLHRKADALTLLVQTGTRLLAEEHPEEVIGAVFSRASELVGLEIWCEFLVSADRPRLSLKRSSGIDTAMRSALEDVPVYGGTGAGMETLPAADAGAAACDAVRAAARPLGVRAWAAFPLVAGRALIGVAAFGSRQHVDLDADALEFLQALSNQIAAAHSRALAGMARRESEERLQQAARIAQLGTFELDFRTGAVLMNDVGMAIHGWAPGARVTLADLEAHFHPDDRERVMRAVDSTMSPDRRDTLDLEHRILREDGAVRWVRVRGRTIFDSTTPERRPVRAIGAHVDITDEKVAEDRAARLFEAERTAREEAERVGRMKDEFLATLSHELRTPLTAILGWSQLLRRRDMPPGEASRAIDIIDRNARAQAQLIDDLLDMSRVVSGRIRIDRQPLDLLRLVVTSVDSTRPAALAHGVELTLKSTVRDTQVLGDATRLQQVLWNLLSNAVKFTPRGGSVAVSVDNTPAGVEVTVADTGIGIDPNFLPHIFEPFSQQDASSTRRHGGVGLGLSIVKHLVELHGGDVRVSSAGAGKGSRFQVTLPIGPVGVLEAPVDRRGRGREAADVNPPDIDLPLLGTRVMIVEDDPDARDLLCRLLQRAGAAVVVVDAGEEALRRLPEETIDVLVSDIGMPDMDGYELIRRIRASTNPLVAATRALALTAYARIEDRDRALGAGYNRYLPKPIDAHHLITIVSEMAQRTADRRKG